MVVTQSSDESYIEIIVDVSASLLETVTEHLMALGALAITESDAGDDAIIEPLPFENVRWKDTRLTALFSEETAVDSVLVALQSTFPTLKPWHKVVAPQNWVTAWQKDFRPTAFGHRLWICPSWLPIPSEAIVPVELDPGLAFGTGTHPTTALCLRWLDAEIHHQSTVVDYGCGSGILGIAALKLGAQYVIGVDHDPQALESSCSNAEKNHLSPEQLTCYLPHQCPTNLQADCVIANIVANPLIQLAPTLCAFLKKGSQLALSGILTTQVETVITAYSPWIMLSVVETEEDWVLLAGKA